MTITDLKDLATIDRLQLMESLWDSFLHEETEPESPQWHADILKERQRQMEDGTADYISIKELRTRR